MSIRISAVRCAAAAAALGALVSLSACSAPTSSPDPEATASASASAPRDVLLDMLRVIDELSRLHGGAWEHEGGEAFDVNRTAGFRGALTCDDEVSRSFSTQILGPGVSDPEEAASAAAEYFASQGFAETNQFESHADGNRYVVQTLSRADGAYVVYQPGTGRSAIEAGSGCSTHPGMTERTT